MVGVVGMVCCRIIVSLLLLLLLLLRIPLWMVVKLLFGQSRHVMLGVVHHPVSIPVSVGRGRAVESIGGAVVGLFGVGRTDGDKFVFEYV